MKAILFGLLLSLAYCADEPEQKDGIYILNAQNFYEFTQLNPETLVLFHDSKCNYCEQTKEILKRALIANEAKYPNLKAAMIDGESDQEVIDQNDVEKTPQLRLYLNKGFFSFYEDELTETGLQHFIDYHLQTLSEPTFVESDRQFIRYKNRQNSIILAFQDITDEERDFAMGLQRVVPDIPVYYMKESSKYGYMVFPEDSSKSKYKMKMKRNFDEGDKFLGTRDMFMPRHILKIVWPYRKNKVEVYSEKHLNSTLRLKRPAVYFFDSDYNSDSAESFSRAVISVNFEGLAIKSTLKEQTSEKLTTIFGITSEDFPAVRILEVKDQHLVKYKYDGPILEKDVESWLTKYKEGELTPYKKTQTPVDNSKNVVHRINRDELPVYIQNKATNLVLGLVGKAGQSTIDLFEGAAEKLKNKGEFTFAVIDVNKNDIDGLNRQKIPLVQILTKTQRQRPLTYDGEAKAEALAAYLNENIDLSDEL